MGIRSEVAFAAKPNVVENLSTESRATLLRYLGEPVETTDEGTLWTTEDVKWYSTVYEDLGALYKELGENFDVGDYLLIEACYECPEHDSEGDIGEWHDNPWELYKEVTVRTNYCLTA